MNDNKMARMVADERAFFVERPCELVAYHAPRPVMTEHHHTKPSFLQNRLYGQVKFDADKYLCGNCHDSVHAWLYWLLGMRKEEPPGIGRAAKTEAEATFAWYQSELEA